MLTSCIYEGDRGECWETEDEPIIDTTLSFSRQAVTCNTWTFGGTAAQGLNTQSSINTTNLVTNACLTTISVMTQLHYTMKVTILDHLGNRVREFTQYFNACGQFASNAASTTAINTMIYWDNRDNDGYTVPPGQYQLVLEWSSGGAQSVYKIDLAMTCSQNFGTCASEPKLQLDGQHVIMGFTGI